jgi:hypothetical protein
MFGFWRFLCAKDYLTSLWVPVLAAAFPNHPAGDVRTIRTDVEDHMQKLHFLRNRIAHHEPIHRRNLADDANAVDDLAAWMSADARDAKRPQHQRHIDSTHSEATNKSPIKVREPEKPLPILHGNHLRKRVKGHPLLRRKEPSRHQRTPAPRS